MSPFKLKSFHAGTVIFKENDEAGPAFVVMYGRVGVYIGGTTEAHRVTTIGKNGVFGEMSLIDGSPRSATIKALENTECIVVNTQGFTKMMSNIHPVARAMFEIISTRLRNANQKLGAQVRQDQVIADQTGN